LKTELFSKNNFNCFAKIGHYTVNAADDTVFVAEFYNNICRKTLESSYIFDNF